MSDQPTTTLRIEASLRIPGNWENADDLARRLPDGYGLVDQFLELPDGAHWEFYPHPADDEFAGVFATGCRQLPSPDERQQIENYTVNFCFAAPAGSPDRALRILRTAAAVVRAGGAGVFVDNSGVAHGGADWSALAHPENEETGPVRAFTSAYRTADQRISSIGMHLVGCPDLLIAQSGDDARDMEHLHRILLHFCRAPGNWEVGAGYEDTVLGTCRVTADAGPQLAPPGSPLHNPFGRRQLERDS